MCIDSRQIKLEKALNIVLSGLLSQSPLPAADPVQSRSDSMQLEVPNTEYSSKKALKA